MKRVFLASSGIFLFAIMLLAACQKDAGDWDSFKAKYASAGTTIRVNGLMKLGLGIALKNENDPDTRHILQILKKMKGVEIHIIPGSAAHFSPSDVVRLSRALDKSHYDQLVSVRKGNQLVNLWALTDKDAFADPLALIYSGNEAVMVEMKGRLTAEDIQTLLNAGKKYVGN